MAHHNEFGVALPHQPATSNVASLSISPARGLTAADRLPEHAGEHLGGLWVRAESTARELDRLIRTAAELSGAGHHAAAELQERLRLGVRMLQAFDVQIQRGEQAGQQLAAQLGPQLQAFIAEQVQAQIQTQIQNQIQAQIQAQVRMHVEARVEAALRQPLDGAIAAASERVDVAIARSIESLEARRAAILAQLDESAASIAGGSPSLPRGEHLAEIEHRVRALVDDAESRLANLEARARALETRSTEAADGLLGTVGTATTLKELVGDEIREQRRLAAETEAAIREVQGDLVALVERCATVRSDLTETLHRSLDASRVVEERVSSATALVDSLESLIGKVDGAIARRPQPAAEDSNAAHLRPAVNEDLLDFTQALRQLAAKAEQSFVNGRFDEFSPARPAAPVAPATSPAPPVLERTAEAGASVRPPMTSQTSGQTSGAPLPIDTRHLTAEILALDATSLLRSKPVA